MMMEKIERGVMIMKDGKAWGIVYEDGRSTSYGWLNPADKQAKIRHPKYCKKVADAIRRDSHYAKEMLTGKLVAVERKTTVTVLEEK